MQGDNGAAHIVHFLLGGIAVDLEYSLPQPPMWVDADESFT
jgi:hypothetical protein